MSEVTEGVKRLTAAAAAAGGGAAGGIATGVVTPEGGTNTSDINGAHNASPTATVGINNDDMINDDDDDNTVATIDKPRKPGPIDVDTSTPHLTPTERRHLRAMHQLGYTHLRNHELPQALSIFTEIYRGQKERHGKRSLQAAMAMHNLGVVCMRCGRYMETIRLCDGAARIRVEKLGKDSVMVATSLSQQGVALMELKEYRVALASFREALRIRYKVFGGNDSSHPLIVRLLNNIGCALFEMNDLGESRVAFENALRMQQELMKAKKKNNGKVGAPLSAIPKGGGDNAFDVNPKDAYHMAL
ncbi:hypothetical protein ACHAXR_000532, partial [Thalassiosira sp. AJA248-18]